MFIRRDVIETSDNVLGILVGCSTLCQGQGGRKHESFLLKFSYYKILVDRSPEAGTDLPGLNEF